MLEADSKTMANVYQDTPFQLLRIHSKMHRHVVRLDSENHIERCMFFLLIECQGPRTAFVIMLSAMVLNRFKLHTLTPSVAA